MNTASIVPKLWNYCNVLRGDGLMRLIVTYGYLLVNGKSFPLT